MMADTRLVVFSDLDGTLLDHESYDWSPAGVALETLKSRGDYLVLASSKTAAEITELRTALGFEHCPAIVENGSGILPPHGTGSDSRHTRPEILKVLSELPKDLRDAFVGFSQMSIKEISRLTGLSYEDAKRAADRQFSEPGLWNGSNDLHTSFLQQLAARGVSMKQGGRFLTLTLGQTKADAMAKIIEGLGNEGREFLTVALGDAPNDLEMLASADIGFLIPNPAHAHSEAMVGQLPSSVKIAKRHGPAGWNQCILSVIDEVKNN